MQSQFDFAIDSSTVVQVNITVPVVSCSTGDGNTEPMQFQAVAYDGASWVARDLKLPLGWAYAEFAAPEGITPQLFCPTCVAKLQATAVQAKADIAVAQPAQPVT